MVLPSRQALRPFLHPYGFRFRLILMADAISLESRRVQPNPRVVEHLEYLLRRARSGDVDGVVTLSHSLTGRCGYTMCGHCVSFEMIGALGIAYHELVSTGAERAEWHEGETPNPPPSEEDPDAV